jgi:TfoX/Sxy family transcriptional regulator of competence genes
MRFYWLYPVYFILSKIMAYDQALADRVRSVIGRTHQNVEEKRMFGGLCFMVNDKMCVGVEKERLMVRLDPALTDEVMRRPGVKPMDFTGRVMKGFVFVDAATLAEDEELEYWLNLALDYNKIAKPSRKRKTTGK